MHWPTRIALPLLFLLPCAARADQCKVLDEGLKPKVIDLLQAGRRFVEWCEPCHEAAPGPTKVIEQIDLAPLEKGTLALHVNDHDTDLAFLYVETMPGSGRFVNAAKAVSCPAHDVSAELHVEPPVAPAPAPKLTADTAKPRSPTAPNGTLSAQRHAAGQP